MAYRYITGLFPDRAAAECAWRSVSERGYGKSDVNLVMSNETRRQHFTSGGAAAGAGTAVDTELGHRAAEGAGIGGAIGGTLGAVAAALAAVGTSVVLPGLGLVIAGPIAAALAGASAGAATGGLVGALIGWGIPEERIREYEDGIERGGILMGVRPRNAEDASSLEADWRAARGMAIHY